MKFTAEQIEYLEKMIIMKDLRITCVGDDIFGDVIGDVLGSVEGSVRGNVEGYVGGTVNSRGLDE